MYKLKFSWIKNEIFVYKYFIKQFVFEFIYTNTFLFQNIIIKKLFIVKAYIIKGLIFTNINVIEHSILYSVFVTPWCAAFPRFIFLLHTFLIQSAMPVLILQTKFSCQDIFVLMKRKLFLPKFDRFFTKKYHILGHENVESVLKLRFYIHHNSLH